MMLRIVTLVATLMMLVGVIGFAQEMSEEVVFEPPSPWILGISSFFSPGSGQLINEGWNKFNPWFHSVVSSLIDSFTTSQAAACGLGIDGTCTYALIGLGGSLGFRIFSAMDAYGQAEARYNFFMGLVEEKYGPDPFGRATE